MSAYYNEIDPFVAAWLRNLIDAGLIPPGDVDERDIRDVKPEDIKGYKQCHFFAGIGGWAYALKLAGWPDDKPVWTGSCPCQPFSTAGRRKGTADERHLWPHWFHLIEQCRPGVVFGEQVASKDALGWLDIVQADLEGAGYACGAVDLCAAGVGAPHIRQRLWFVAERVADTNEPRLQERICDRQVQQEALVAHGRQAAGRGGNVGQPGQTNGFWRASDWLLCRDGKWRPVESGTFPLVNGVSARVGRLRAYGNAIVPQVAAAFISSYIETTAAV